MIDTHCHLTDPRLASQVEAVLQRAVAAGVSHVITIGTTLDDSRRCVELCAGRTNVRCTVGIHPHHAAEHSDAQVVQIEVLAADASVLAIGEIGLDYHYTFSPRDRQIEVFRRQMQIAQGRKLPAVIHCREATEDCLSVMRDFPGVPGLFHCFTGSLGEARQILAAGYLLGITGVVTFKKSDELREVVRQTPLDRLVLETDAPYLSPEPMRRQKTNEPALMMHTAQFVADLKGVSLADLEQHTRENARRFFNWP